MSLLQQLQNANYQGIAVAGPQPVSYRQLIQAAYWLRRQYPQLQQQSVAISNPSLCSFIAALLAFDGWCQQLYLLPEPPVAIPEQTLQLPPIVLPPPQDMASPPVAEHNSHSDSRWYLATSGTTGSPKWLSHSLAGLSRAVKRSAPHIWGLCYQPCRFAGIQVVLQSLLSGGQLVDASTGDAEQRLQTLQQYQASAVSATPSLWRQLLLTGQLSSLSLQQLTLGGEIADQPLLNQLAQCFPDSRLLHIYASTEAGVGFSVADKQAGFPFSWLADGHSGLAFKIDAQQHLWLKPPHRPDPSLANRLDADGYLDTEDLVTIQAERVLFLGRASGVINVGGNKVHPEQVEQVLLQVTDVLQAKVYAKASSVLGQLVVADIVAAVNTDHTRLQPLLFKHCQQQLARYQIPTRFNFVDSLNTNATGKLTRKGFHD